MMKRRLELMAPQAGELAANKALFAGLLLFRKRA